MGAGMVMNRRLFLGGLAAFIAAPAIVARENIMAIKPDRGVSGLTLMIESAWRWQEQSGGWLVVHPDYVCDLRIALDLADESGDAAVSRYMTRGGVVEIGGFKIIESPTLTASNYGRGPGLLTEDARGVRSWTPPAPTAREIEAKRAEAFLDMRRWLEPKGGRRWV